MVFLQRPGTDLQVLVHLRTTVRMWAADASRVGLVSDWKRLKLKHMCFAVCRSSARERAFSGPKSPDAPEPPNLRDSSLRACKCYSEELSRIAQTCGCGNIYE